MSTCGICKRPLDQPGDETTRDCGGDCLRCMATVGDPGCVESMIEIATGRAAAVQAEREACLAVIKKRLEYLNDFAIAWASDGARSSSAHVAEIEGLICARGPTDALAAALAKAREEALREAAEIAASEWDNNDEGASSFDGGGGSLAWMACCKKIEAAIRALAGKEQGK